MAEEVEPVSQLGMAAFRGSLGREKFIKPLQDKVKACSCGPAISALSSAARVTASSSSG